MTNHMTLTQHFFHQCLSSFVHATALPKVVPELSLPALKQHIEKHHLRPVFMLLLQKIPEFTELVNIPSDTMMTHYLTMMQSLVQVVQAFQTKAIRPIILKGIPLNIQLYGQQCLRTIRDIDVLIEHHELIAAHQCLMELGYELKSLLHPEDLAGNYAFIMRHASELLYQHPNTKVAIDLKWCLSPVYCRTSIWCDRSNTMEMTITSQKITILNHEQNFVYLAMHAAKHHWQHLKWLLDLGGFYQKTPLSWPQVLLLTQRAGAVRPVLETTILLERLFKIKTDTVPHTFWDKIITNLRLRLIQTEWGRPRTQASAFKQLLLSLLLYAHFSQKRHYLTQIYLLRTHVLQHMKHFRKPSVFKMVAKGVFYSKKLNRFLIRFNNLFQSS